MAARYLAPHFALEGFDAYDSRERLVWGPEVVVDEEAGVDADRSLGSDCYCAGTWQTFAGAKASGAVEVTESARACSYYSVRKYRY